MNAKPTPGPWAMGEEANYIHRRAKSVVVKGNRTAGHYLIADLREAAMPREEADACAALIVAAVNACFAVNPDNPLAVAEGMAEVVEAVKELLDGYLYADAEGLVSIERADESKRLRAVLAKLEAKP